MDRRNFLKLAVAALACLGLRLPAREPDEMPVQLGRGSALMMDYGLHRWWNPTGDCDVICAWEAQIGSVYLTPECLTAEQIVQVIGIWSRCEGDESLDTQGILWYYWDA